MHALRYVLLHRSEKRVREREAAALGPWPGPLQRERHIFVDRYLHFSVLGTLSQNVTSARGVKRDLGARSVPVNVHRTFTSIERSKVLEMDEIVLNLERISILTGRFGRDQHPPETCRTFPLLGVYIWFWIKSKRIKERKPQNPNPKPKTPKTKHQTSNPKTPDPNPKTQNLKPQTPNLQHQSSDHKPQTPNPQPQTPNPKPQTPKNQTQNLKPETPDPNPRPGLGTHEFGS
jgi:hypothetical protein